MRTLLGAAIIALLLPTAGLTQSLADAARQERVRRESLAYRGDVYNNARVRALFGLPELEELSGVSAQTGLPPDEGDTGDARGAAADGDSFASDEEPESEEAMIQRQAAIAEQQALVQDLEDEYVRQTLETGRLRALLTAPTGSQRLRNQIQAQLTAALGGLEELQTALDSARAELERLDAEGPGRP